MNTIYEKNMEEIRNNYFFNFLPDSLNESLARAAAQKGYYLYIYNKRIQDKFIKQGIVVIVTKDTERTYHYSNRGSGGTELKYDGFSYCLPRVRECHTKKGRLWKLVEEIIRDLQ